MSMPVVWIMLSCTLLCSACGKTRGVSLGSTSEEDVVDAGTGDRDDDDDDNDDRHDERHRGGDDDDGPFWLEPIGAPLDTTKGSSLLR